MFEDVTDSRPGSWSVLASLMIMAYAVVRWIPRISPYLVMPMTFFIKFISARYEQEINQVGVWIRSRFLRRTKDVV